MAEEAKRKKDRGLWFREMKSELKKVVWPNRQTVVKNTGTVLLCSLVIGACIWIFDFVAVSAVDLILHVFGAEGERYVRQREVVCDPYLFRL